MQDIIKLFEIIKNTRSDNDAVTELGKHLDTPHEYPPFVTAGYKPASTSSTAVFSGYNSSSNNDSDHRESSLFAYAVSQNKLNTAAMLLQRLGVDILLKTNDKKENGFHAVANCSNEIFRLWFFRESNVSTLTQLSDQFKALINQISTADEHVFSLLFPHKPSLEELNFWIRIGADPAVITSKSGNLLSLASEKNRPDLVKYLCQYYPQLLRIRNEKGQQPVHLAAGQDSPECLKALIEAGTPTSTQDKAFNRPLHHAVAKGRVAAARMILQQEQLILLPSGKSVPYVNVHNGSLETPLHLLVTHLKYYNETSFREMLDLLLNYGGDFTLVNDKGLTPIKLAKEEKIAPSYFEMLWSRFNEKLNPELFTRDTLSLLICQHYPAGQAQQLLQALSPVFSSLAPDPFQAIRQDYVEHLKQMAPIRYPDQPQISQPFTIMLDQLAEFSRMRLQQGQAQGPILAFQYQQNQGQRSDSSMNVSGNLQTNRYQ
jgi:ankyrin repeat protein